MRNERLFLLLFMFLNLNICFGQQNLSRTLDEDGTSVQLPFSSMDVFDLEWATNPQISPDGKQMVYVRRGMDIMKDNRKARIWIVNADGSGHQKLTSNEVNEGNPQWSPDGQRIAFTASTEEGSELFVYWKESQKIAKISQLPASPSGIRWSPDGKQIAFSMFVAGSELSLVRPPKKPKGAKWADPPRVTTRLKHEADGSGYLKPGYRHIFVIPSEGGTPRQLTSGDYHHRSAPAWSPYGKDLYISANREENWEYDFRNSEIYKVRVSDGKTTRLTNRKGPDHSVACSPDGSKIAYLGYDDKVQTYQLTKLYVMDTKSFAIKEIATGLDRSLSGVVWDGKSAGLYYMYDDKGDTKIGYSNLSGGSSLIASNVGGTAIGRPYGGGSFSVSNQDRIVYTHTDPYHPADVVIFNKGETGLKLRKLTQLNADLLEHRKLASVKEIWYKSSLDGRDIQGWYALPADFDGSRKYPLLVENHGGPISNYGPRFSPEIQLYASAGYIVFYPNPRGSTSYGEEFGNLLYHDYPGGDYQDVMDGVDAMLKKGDTSEDSLFVTGGSAGGIMTAWMIGKNNRFQAAAVVKPVMNWISKTLTADNYYGYANSRYPGQPWENMAVYMKYSPISLVGNVETPTLVMVGTADMRTPLSEAKQLYHALKLRKIETALVEIPGAYHFIARRPSQLITKVEHVLAWFERYR